MGEYVRVTREWVFGELNPALLAAMRTHIAKYELGSLEAAALFCCETTSTRQKKGLFGGKTEVTLCGVLLTPDWLVWAAGKSGEAPGVLSARLRDIQVQDYEKSDLYRLMPDSGLTINGLRTDPVDLGSAFIGLGSEPAAQKFRNLLREAQAKA